MSKKKHNYNQQEEIAEEIYEESQDEIIEEIPISSEEEIVEESIPTTSQHTTCIHAAAGEKVYLNNTSIYRSFEASEPFMKLTGTFYFYDRLVQNGRARITTHEDIKTNKNINYILGYIQID